MKNFPGFDQTSVTTFAFPVKTIQANGVRQPCSDRRSPSFLSHSLPSNGYETLFWDPSIRPGLQITYQSLWSLSFVPPLLMPLLVLMHLTDAAASNLLIWARAPFFVSIQMKPAGWGGTTPPPPPEMESMKTVPGSSLYCNR